VTSGGPSGAIVRSAAAVASAAVRWGRGRVRRPAAFIHVAIIIIITVVVCAHEWSDRDGTTERRRGSATGASEKNPSGGLVDIESRPKNRCPNTVPYPAERLRWIRPTRSGAKWEGVRCFRAAVSIGGGSAPRPADQPSDSAAAVDDGFAR